MKTQSRLIWIFILIIASVMGVSSFIIALMSSLPDASGWWQVFLGSLSFPLLIYELSQLRQTMEQKPEISVGIVNIKNYPLYSIRVLESLPNKINVSQGYPFFSLAIRNSGTAVAKNVKIHFEFLRPEQLDLHTPIVKVDDWLDDKRYSFKQENNVDFIFVGGSDWIIHPSDTEVFNFFISTASIIQKEPVEIRERPALGKYRFRCYVWAEKLNAPIDVDLTVKVVEELN